jgi:hypothetical protein
LRAKLRSKADHEQVVLVEKRWRWICLATVTPSTV